MQDFFYGEEQCSAIIKNTATRCINYAYFTVDGNKLLCGMHSQRLERKQLPHNPKPNAINEKRFEIAKDVALSNKSKNIRGKVMVSNLHMMKSPTYVEGYLNVFPNFKHQNRKDGFGCSSLSPMSLGPVNHNMPNLPPAQNIENFHQYAKFWSFELDPVTGLPTPEYFEKRCDGYRDTVPHRHKYPKEILIKYCDNINIPECSIYPDEDGNDHKYTYIQCRYFYCHYYELLAKKTNDFKKLQKMIANGWNLNILGYDGRSIRGTTKGLFEAYLDKSKPFGHELVLYSLLVLKDPAKYPWNIYYKCKEKIYKGVI